MPTTTQARVFSAAVTVFVLAGLSLPTAAVGAAGRDAGKPAATARPVASTSNLQQAAALFRQGKYNEAIKIYDAAIAARKIAGKSEQDQYAEALLGLGRALNAKQDYEGALDALTRATAIAEAFDLPSELKAQIQADIELLKNKAQSVSSRVAPRHYSSYGRSSDMYDAAEEEYLKRASIEFTRNRFGPTSTSYLSRNIEYAKFLARQHRPDDVAKVAGTINETFGKMDADGQASAAPQMLEMAQNLADNNLPIQADMMGNGVVQAVSGNAWKNVPDLAARINSVATSLERHQNGELAQKYYAAAVTAFEKSTKPDDPQLAKMRTALAQFYRKAGKNGAALELLELAAAAQMKNAMAGDTEAIQTLAALTDAYAMTGNFPKAKESGEKLVDALRVTNAEVSVPFKSLIETAGFIAARGDVQTAEKLYTAALMSLKKSRDHRVSDYEVQNELKSLAHRFAALGMAEQAERVYDTLIQARQNAAGQPTSLSIPAYIDKAQYFIEQDDMAKATQALDQAIELSARFSQHRERFGDLARQLQEKKQYTFALKLLQASIDETDTNRSAQSISDAKTRMATINSLLGKNDEATRIFQEIETQTMERLPARMAPAKTTIHTAIGKLIAEKKFQQASEMISSIENSVHYSHQGDALARMAYILLPLQMYTETEELLGMALTMQSESYGPSSLQAGGIMRQQAQIFQTMGKGQKAQEMYEADRAIQAMYQKQQQLSPGGSTIFKPFAPLSETLSAFHKESNSETNSGTGFSLNSIRVPR